MVRAPKFRNRPTRQSAIASPSLRRSPGYRRLSRRDRHNRSALRDRSMEGPSAFRSHTASLDTSKHRHARYALSSKPGPRALWTLMAARTTSEVRRFRDSAEAVAGMRDLVASGMPARQGLKCLETVDCRRSAYAVFEIANEGIARKNSAPTISAIPALRNSAASAFLRDPLTGQFANPIQLCLPHELL